MISDWDSVTQLDLIIPNSLKNMQVRKAPVPRQTHAHWMHVYIYSLLTMTTRFITDYVRPLVFVIAAYRGRLITPSLFKTPRINICFPQ